MSQPQHKAYTVNEPIYISWLWNVSQPQLASSDAYGGYTLADYEMWANRNKARLLVGNLKTLADYEMWANRNHEYKRPSSDEH